MTTQRRISRKGTSLQVYLTWHLFLDTDIHEHQSFFFHIKCYFLNVKDIVERKPLQGLQAFLERTGSCITDGTLHAVKTVFQGMTHLEST